VGLAVLVKTALSRSRPTEIASAEQNAVLDQLVVLEREHAEARLPEDAYERQHAALVAQLRTVPAPEA
jgi:hypothetical protein